MNKAEEQNAGSRIRLLPIHVANQIAAGEVVERPASVVKELMENAIDADSSRIDVVVTAGGRKLISVSDDGRGMNRDDVLMSIERQATSKIHEVTDIEHISTMGFRGEALASIASVARFLLRSCPRGENVGTELVVTGGRIQDVRDSGGPCGTVIEIRDLFFNVPARRKFLRAYQTEQAHIRATFTTHALAHPAIAMSLNVDGRELHRLPPCEHSRDRVRDLLGVEMLAQLCEVPRFERSGVRVKGFVARPTYTRADRSEQYIFINGRPASAPVLYYAIREAYPKLERDRRPAVVLFLEMDPGLVDVNVHPTKREVRFRRSSDVRDAVMFAVRSALGSEELSSCDGGDDASASPVAPESSQSELSGVFGAPAVLPPPAAVPRVEPQQTFPLAAASRRSEQVVSSYPSPADHPLSESENLPQEAQVNSESCKSSPWAWCRVLGQVSGRYALLETDGGFVVIDPKAAHERVLFDKLMAQLRCEVVESQQLLLPQTVDLPPRDAVRLRKNLDYIVKMGFGVDSFGGDTFVVDALPVCVADTQCRDLLIDVAHGLEVAGARRGRERWREEAIARAASATAVRQRQKMSDEEIGALVKELAATEMPYTCPRGRPTMIFTSLRELNRKFGRE